MYKHDSIGDGVTGWSVSVCPDEEFCVLLGEVETPAQKWDLGVSDLTRGSDYEDGIRPLRFALHCVDLTLCKRVGHDAIAGHVVGHGAFAGVTVLGIDDLVAD